MHTPSHQRHIVTPSHHRQCHGSRNIDSHKGYVTNYYYFKCFQSQLNEIPRFRVKFFLILHKILIFHILSTKCQKPLKTLKIEKQPFL